MSLSNKEKADYIELINAALDAIPLQDQLHFEAVAIALEAVLADPTTFTSENRVWGAAVMHIPGFLVETDSYVRSEERTEYLAIIQARIQDKIKVLRTLSLTEQAAEISRHTARRELAQRNHTIMASHNAPSEGSEAHVLTTGAWLAEQQARLNATVFSISTPIEPDRARMDISSLVNSLLLSQSEMDSIMMDVVQRNVFASLAAFFFPSDEIALALELFQSPEYRYIQNNVFQAIDAEIMRLRRTYGCMNEASALKEQQLSAIITEIKTGLSQHILTTLVTPDVTKELLVQETYRNVVTPIRNIATQPFIHKRRDYVGAFFNGLLGILLAMPCAFVPLGFSSYRQRFFGTRSGYTMHRVADHLVEQNRRVHSV